MRVCGGSLTGDYLDAILLSDDLEPSRRQTSARIVLLAMSGNGSSGKKFYVEVLAL
jgi:hypothetical protein